MIYPIVRLYGSVQQATNAVSRLHAEGIPANAIDVVTSAGASAPGGAGGEDPLVAAIVRGYVLKRHATVYAQGVRRGGALVIVRAPFSWGGDVIEILDGFGPIDSGVPLREELGRGWDEATPLSSILWLAPLANSAASFSAFWNLPILSRTGRTGCSVLGIGELASPASSLSRTLGLPLLSRGAAPLSSVFRLPLLA